MDEPLFLAPARHILADPRHPLAFNFNWYGETVPMTEINNTPPLTLYLLAFALKATGGGERAMKMFLLPFDLAAASALYLLAARFLASPLLPTLIVLAGPAYLISMGQLNPDKFCLAAGLWALYLTVRSCDSGRLRWGGPAALLGLSILFKYAGIVFLIPALCYARQKGAAPRRLACFTASALAPLGLYLGWDGAHGAGAWGSAWNVIWRSAADSWADWVHKLRSFLSFVGGCGVVIAVWPFLTPAPGRSRAFILYAVIPSLLLFWPGFDIEPVRILDRIMGLGFSITALAALGLMFSKTARSSEGWFLWSSWVVSGACLQIFVYWAVLARITVFFLPPLIFFLAQLLEKRFSARSLRGIYAVSLAMVAFLSASLSWVDHVYAEAQREFARQVVEPYVRSGRRVYFEGHWGLQYYMEKAGAELIDHRAYGWEAVRPGDIVVASRVNSNSNLTFAPRVERAHRIRRDFSARVESAVPLRLMSGWTGQGGFYANSWGFLPYSFSFEPVEEFLLGEHL